MEKKLANLGAVISRVSEAESSNINEFAEKDINYGKGM
jgi:hypothetical protein